MDVKAGAARVIAAGVAVNVGIDGEAEARVIVGGTEVWIKPG